MEPWEVSHIQRNKFNLQQLTKCSALLRAVLQEHGVLEGNDISRLDAAQNSKGTLDESELLYNILITRKGALNALIDACEKTKQTGALHILQRGSLEYIQSNFTKWDELSDDLKIEMRNKLVAFQGKLIKLSDRCNHHLHYLICGKFLIELAKGNTPTLVSNQVSDQLEYYIHRTLRSRNRLKSSVFQQPCDDVFVVVEMERYKLSSLVDGENMDVSGNQIKRLTVRFILLEFEGDFERICKLTSSPVHLIRCKNNIYEWVKSSGSVKNLQKHVDDVQDCFLEEELASRGTRVNLISDSPGMGKTILLGSIAQQINREKPNMLIRFIYLKEFVQALNKKTINLDSIVSLIAKKSSEFEGGMKFVKHILTSEPCILMFDGFDEVLLNQVETAKRILSTIVTLKSAQIFVTTRPHMREVLENTLNVLGYKIDPFTDSHQVNFLLNFWKIKGATVNQNMKQFATSCVKTISSAMTDFERGITGIPLQCRLLAECYTEQAMRWSQIGAAPSNSKPIGQINSIFEMYEMHMKMRLEKICEDSMMKRIAVRFFNKQSKFEAIKSAHIIYALELLFPEQVHQFQSLKSPSISINELCAAGFLEVTNSENVQFVHRTFAEFFVAWFAVEMKMPEKITPFLLDDLLATKLRQEFLTTPVGKVNLGLLHTFSYPVIAYFINGLSKINSKNQGDPYHSSRVSMLMNSVHYEQVSRIFLASAVSDYQFVPLLVSLCFEPLQISKKVNSDILKLLLISAKYSSVALVNTFCSQIELTNLKSPFKIGLLELTPMHVAVQRGHYHLVEFLACKYDLELENLPCLLHFCVFESLKDNKETITDKMQIIRLLSRKSNVLLNEKFGDGTVSLLQKDVICELIKCLIECGADVNVRDEKGNNILHKITENPVTPEFYHWLVVSLHERQFKHFNHSNRKKVSPLHCAVEKVELLDYTLKYFQLNGVDFNAEDEQQEPPLFYAIRGGRSVSLIRFLTECGAQMTIFNKHLQMVLHICANHGHYHAMKYFVQTSKMDVNVKDKNWNTPLHLAAMRRSNDYQDMQQFLVTCGANVNALILRNRVLYDPLKIALMLGKGLTLIVIKLMEEHGLSMDVMDASELLKGFLSNRNILTWEIDEEFVQVLEYLIEKGGVIDDNIWESEGLKKNLRAIIQSTDWSSLWDHVKTSDLLAEPELEEIRNLSSDSSNKCECFYRTVLPKKGSFERVCILLIASNQMTSLLLLRESLYFAISSNRNMFVTPPTFTNQFIHSQQNSSLTSLVLVTTNPFLTVERIRNTIRESGAEIKEVEILSHLQKVVHEDLIFVKVRVLTGELISRLVARGASQCKVIFVCSAVSKEVEDFQVATDTLPTWDDISTLYFEETVGFYFLNDRFEPIFELFESSLMLSKLSQLLWVGGQLLHDYSVVRFKVGHINMKHQSKNYLCPTIFHYVLPDKLVFLEISIEKLKEFAHFGHKIGYFGEDDVENLDFVIVKQSYQFDEICKQTSENVHLIEYEQEKVVFKLVKTWGWEDNIQWFLKQPLCEGFPHCDCVPDNQNLVVSLLIETTTKELVYFNFECFLPINEFTPRALRRMKLENAEEFSNIKALLTGFVERQDTMYKDFNDKPRSEQLVNLVTEHLSTFLVERELHHVAINSLFPNLAKLTNVIKGLEKYQQLGMVKQIADDQIVFVDKSLAWYFIAKLLLGLRETTEFDEISRVLRIEIFQNCFRHVEVVMGYNRKCLHVINSNELLRSFEFINIMCFRFIDALLKNNCDKDITNIESCLKSIITSEPQGYKWIHACVNANLFHLTQLIVPLEINSVTSAFESEELVLLAVIHAAVPMVRLVAEEFVKKTKRKLTEIQIYFDNNSISMVSLAALRGNYCVVEYLLNEHGFRHNLQKHKNLGEVGKFNVVHTIHNSAFEVNERKRIFDLLLRIDKEFVKEMSLSFPKIHGDLIVYMINIGVDIHAQDPDNCNTLHLCPEYLTPQEYHEVVTLIHKKDDKSIARLLQQFDSKGETAFHVAVQHLELLHETLTLFVEAGVNINAVNGDGNNVFVHSAKHFRSARLLDALHRLGADIYLRDKAGRPATFYCEGNQTALRFLSSRGVPIY